MAPDPFPPLVKDEAEPENDEDEWPTGRELSRAFRNNL